MRRRRRCRPSLRACGSCSGEEPHALERLEVLERLAANKNAELRQTIDLRRAGRIDQALEIVRTDRGKQAMDEIRKTIAGMRDRRARAAGRTRARTAGERRPSVTSVIWGGSALLLFLIGAGGQHVVARLHGPAHAGLDPHGRERAGWPDAGAGTDRGPGPADRQRSWASTCRSAVGAVYFAGFGRSAAARGRRTRCRTTASDAPVGGLTRQAFADNRAIETQELPADFFPVSSGVGARAAPLRDRPADHRRRAGQTARWSWDF